MENLKEKIKQIENKMEAERISVEFNSSAIKDHTVLTPLAFGAVALGALALGLILLRNPKTRKLIKNASFTLLPSIAKHLI